ncbi:MAG: NAD(+) synthase [Vulcanimicrobiota bacterium]
MRIAIAQINSRVGDLEGNRARILAAYAYAAERRAELVVFPEMIVTGYPPLDLVYDSALVTRVEAINHELAEATAGGPAMILGSLGRADFARPNSPGLYNQAVVAEGGHILARRAKQILPCYDVFHEPRWFEPGPPTTPVEVAGKRLGILLCEDLWDESYTIHPGAELTRAGAEILVCLSASPYRQGIEQRRLEMAARQKLPLIYVNAVGGQDELIFDGGSFCHQAGSLHQVDQFDECITIVTPGSCCLLPEPSWEARTWQALKLGVRDFLDKNRLYYAVLGLSGGIDSALVACLAADAVGPERVLAVALPSRHNDPRSTESAAELARRLGIKFEVRSLEPLHAAAEASLDGLLEGTGAENVQARLRMVILMAYVNRFGGTLLNTSNKTELSLGYGTLYGDLAGTLSPLGDLTKPQVYQLARRTVIPDFILERPPSAELRPEQVDPFDYARVAPRIEATIAERRVDPGLERHQLKRRQGPIVLKVSVTAFGGGRLMPVTNGYRPARLPRNAAG